MAARTSSSRGVSWDSGERSLRALAATSRSTILGFDHRFPGGHRLDRGDELRAIVHPFLEEVRAPVRARLQEGEHVRGLGVLAQHDDADLRMLDAQAGSELDPLVGLRRGHADVREDDVGVVRVAGVAQGVEVAHRGDDLHRRVDRQHLLQAFPDDQAVLSDSDADGHGAANDIPPALSARSAEAEMARRRAGCGR